MGEIQALDREYELGRTVLREAVEGALKFAKGAGRGGSFSEFKVVKARAGDEDEDDDDQPKAKL